ncbi:hypothetical protein MFIFM68171_06411 [Madurella fahalii]|uniref:Uncharacterized protein n=1 Tax=Madurella fahalii TaxID=1157608 RepID=A0ABQ0GEK5_9PEZI
MTALDREDALPLSKSSADNVPYVRLHVTPLDAELLKVVVSSALLPKARNISYHTIETFPEKRYGFLELPNEDAEKLRKKLNGAVLKGVKIRIERARPSGIPTPLAEAAMAKEKTSKRSDDGVRPRKDKNKKRKRDAEELSGVVLEEGRTIKRGWTTADEPKEKRPKKDKDKKDRAENMEKKKQAKSKYTSHAECLVKTVLPANAVASADASSTSPTKKKKKGKSREIIVHEFERTTKFPTFLKTAASTNPSRAPLQFVDGKGWVDENGNVVEAVKTRRPPPTRPEDEHPEIRQETGDSDSTSDDASGGTSGPVTPSAAGNDNPAARAAKLDPTSSPSITKPDPLRPKSSGSIRSLAIKIPPTTPNEPKVVHPLEALYKRPKQPDGGVSEEGPDAQGFSFFSNGSEENAGEDDDAEAGDVSGIQLPMTPFTRQDFELRGIRSAAPTPDTAHPNQRFKPWEEKDDDDDDKQQDDENPTSNDSEDEEPNLSNTAAAQTTEGKDKPASDFQKWFWENRGDLNRSWKKRRKLAGKEKRYRENRARIARAI